ncbi:MAG: hypothetical protein ABGZ17_02130 [Planctomycetaceae bacterium]
MWCANCQADVAAEVTANKHRILCASCGNDLAGGTQGSSTPQARQAQQILDRWSNQTLTAPASPAVRVSHAIEPSLSLQPTPTPSEPSAPALSPSAVAEQTDAHVAATIVQPVDAGQPRTSEPAPVEQPVDDIPTAPPSPSHSEHSTLRFDTPQTPLQASEPGHGYQPNASRPPRRAVPQPTAPSAAACVAEPAAAESQPMFSVQNFDAQLEISRRQQRQAKWVASIAQFLAYCGIGGLTVGTACVIWGYFGGVSNYLPMGWLVLSFGQMLLFLGMVTMVSCSVEQANTDVTRQLAEIQKQLARMTAQQPRTQPPAAKSDQPVMASPTVQSADRRVGLSAP